MTYNRKANLAIILLILGVIVAFAYSYNSSVTTSVNNAAEKDREALRTYNTDIISKLCEAESSEEWDTIVEDFEDVVIVVRDADNNVIARSENKSWTTLDAKVRSPFEYHGKAYLLTSSIYLLRNYGSQSKALLKFFSIEFLIGISALCLLIFIIYTWMLKPYHRLYNLIENYEKTGELKEVHFKGYIGKVYERFVSMTKHIERQQKNQQRIIASISHDIKTPLTSILGYAERLQKDNLPVERQERYLSTVYQKSKEIQALIDEFDEYLSFNMLKETNAEPVRIDDLQKYIIADYASELEFNNIKFEVNNYTDNNCTVMIDKARMKRVFGNIIGNSVKHLNKPQKIIVIDFHSSKDKVLMNISDNGAGVEKERLEIIFEPLYTSDEGRKVAGLGLAICKEIIESHKGNIYAKQSDLGGLEICIELSREK